MKGAVFIAFNQMVEEQVGVDVWERLLDEVNPASGGIYISIEDFPDEELFALVGKLSEISGQPVPVLVESFGCFLFDFLNNKYPLFSESEKDFFSFLESIDGVIHKEVRKLYDNANLPELECDRESNSIMVMRYRSPRKLCTLAEGLIRGAAKYYSVEYSLDHLTCQHKDDQCCTFRIELK
ncbi:MAG: heme NO-binding domain-containing protein [Cellvibrionaceae bacterium]